MSFHHNTAKFLFILLNMLWKMKHLPVWFSRAQLQFGISMPYAVFLCPSFSLAFLGSRGLSQEKSVEVVKIGETFY
jgi:hypothetical protein